MNASEKIEEIKNILEREETSIGQSLQKLLDIREIAYDDSEEGGEDVHGK